MAVPASDSAAAGAGLLPPVDPDSVVDAVPVVPPFSVVDVVLVPASDSLVAGAGLDDSPPLGCELLPPLLLEEPPPQAQTPAIIAPAMMKVRT